MWLGMCMYGCPRSERSERGPRREGAKRPVARRRRVAAAGCFSLNEGVMQFQYEDCVECGTCDIMCTPGSVKWNNPRGSFGVKYKYG